MHPMPSRACVDLAACAKKRQLHQGVDYKLPCDVILIPQSREKSLRLLFPNHFLYPIKPEMFRSAQHDNVSVRRVGSLFVPQTCDLSLIANLV